MNQNHNHYRYDRRDGKSDRYDRYDRYDTATFIWNIVVILCLLLLVASCKSQMPPLVTHEQFYNTYYRKVDTYYYGTTNIDTILSPTYNGLILARKDSLVIKKDTLKLD